MSKFHFAVITVVFILLTVIPVRADDKDKKIMPKPVPINLKPPSYDESYMGLGYNKITALSTWNDSWLTGSEEEVGDIKYNVNNVVAGMVKSRGSKSTMELDLLIGTVDFKEDTTMFHYNSLNKDMDVKAEGDGYDIGVRYITSRNFARQSRIEWNYAISLHAAYFYTDGSYQAISVDNSVGEAYDEEEWGFFFRPVISLQPIISLSNSVSIVPYLGFGTNITLSEYYWKNTEYIIGGTSQPGQFSDGEDIYFNVSGVETLIGFDIGFITSQSKKHKLTLGGAMSELMGGDDSSFQEVHVLYSIPTGW